MIHPICATRPLIISTDFGFANVSSVGDPLRVAYLFSHAADKVFILASDESWLLSTSSRVTYLGSSLDVSINVLSSLFEERFKRVVLCNLGVNGVIRRPSDMLCLL